MCPCETRASSIIERYLPMARKGVADGLERSRGEQSGKGHDFGQLQRVDLQVSAKERRYDLQFQRTLEVRRTALPAHLGEIVERDGEV
jgi:hypothetical protein